MVLEPIQVFVALSTRIAPVRLLLLHTERTRIWRCRLRINNGEGPISIVMKLLVVVAMLYYVRNDTENICTVSNN
jgi:hypothetical protein